MTEYLTCDVSEAHAAIQGDSTFSADDNSDLSDYDAGEYDNDYCPKRNADVSSTESEAEDVGEDYHSKHNGMKFLVYFSCLVPLLPHCFTCNANAEVSKMFTKGTAEVSKMFTKGTALCIKLLSPNQHILTWYSQPIIKVNFWVIYKFHRQLSLAGAHLNNCEIWRIFYAFKVNIYKVNRR